MGHRISRPIAATAMIYSCQCHEVATRAVQNDGRHILSKLNGPDVNRRQRPTFRLPYLRPCFVNDANASKSNSLGDGSEKTGRFQQRRGGARRRPRTSVGSMLPDNPPFSLMLDWTDVVTQAAYRNSNENGCGEMDYRSQARIRTKTSSTQYSGDGDIISHDNGCDSGCHCASCRNFRGTFARVIVFLFNRESRRERAEKKGKDSPDLPDDDGEGPPPSLPQDDFDAVPTDVTTLRSLFGTNRNRLWGDLDAPTARKLYQALLPRALLRLYAEGLAPDELAPLAYEARVAAKVYARERCSVPGRVAATAYDGFRHLKKYGKWSSRGMSWEQLWDKYEEQIREEVAEIDPSVPPEDLTSKVCLRILERSCSTNPGIDRLLLNDSYFNLELDRLDKEVEDILQQKKEDRTINGLEFKFLRNLVQLRRTTREIIVDLIDTVPENGEEGGTEEFLLPSKEDSSNTKLP